MAEDHYFTLIDDALRLIREHADVLPDAARLAQGKQLERLRIILYGQGEAVPDNGHLRLRGTAGIAFLSGLTDCLARLRRCAQERDALHPALPELERREAAVRRVRDRVLTLHQRDRRR